MAEHEPEQDQEARRGDGAEAGGAAGEEQLDIYDLVGELEEEQARPAPPGPAAPLTPAVQEQPTPPSPDRADAGQPPAMPDDARESDPAPSAAERADGPVKTDPDQTGGAQTGGPPITVDYASAPTSASASGSATGADPNNPRAAAHAILPLMVRHDTLAQGSAIAAFAAGLGVCFVTILIATNIVWLFLVVIGLGVPYLILFVIVAVTLVPLLFWLEQRYYGDYFADRMSNSPAEEHASSRGEWGLTRGEAFSAGIVEILLTGPRWALQGLGARSAKVRATPATLETAAQVICDLLAAGEAVPVKSLLEPGEPLDHLDHALGYLERNDWIGRSGDLQRIWLLTDARNYLVEQGVRVASKTRR